jgi:hypothetical protein
MSLLRFFEWLATTSGSVALHESHYLFLVILTIHVLTLSVLVGTAMAVDLRLLGLTLKSVPASEIFARLVPWTIGSFLAMIATGSLLFYAAPVQQYQNLFFRFKMVTLALVVANSLLFHRTVYRRIADWDLSPVPPRAARVAAGVSLALWGAMITLGRLIAYEKYWFE